MKNSSRIFSLFLLCYLIKFSAVIVLAKKSQKAAIISADSIKKHVYYLGSDALEGRGTGTDGERKAAVYIASRLEKYGLTPIGDEQSFFQSIPMHGSHPLRESKLKYHKTAAVHSFELNRDYLLYKSGAQTFIPQPVPLVFVGYGIIAPEYDYNDYQSIDVDGKIVIFLAGEPPSNDSTYFAGTDPTIYSYPESKQRIALSRGAKGSILIPSPRDEQGRNWYHWVNVFAFEDVTLAYSVAANLSILMNPNAAIKLFKEAPFALPEIFKMDNAGTIQSFNVPGHISFQGKFIEREFISNNVVGLIPGQRKQPNDRYLIISAHYDHLGIGRPVKKDSIYNGVFDNAVGVAGVLELARVFSSLHEQTRHSILFLFTTGEEKGLLGSTYYTDHPLVPLYKTIAAVNVDGLSMFDRFKEIIGVGAEYSSLGEDLTCVAQKMGLKIAPIPSQFISSESFVRSDQIAFSRAGIPSILIANGLEHENLTRNKALRKTINWMKNYYHTPFDDLNQFMNFAAAEQHCKLLFEFCNRLANQQQTPKWKSGTPYINARLRSIAEKR